MTTALLPFLGILDFVSGLLGIGDNIFSDLFFVIKLLMVLMIISFVRAEPMFQNPLVQIAVIGGITYFAFQNFALFGGLSVLFFLMGAGLVMFLFDLMFYGGTMGGIEHMRHGMGGLGRMKGMFRRR